MYPSPHQWTIPSNDHAPLLSMGTQPSIFTTSNRPVETHIPASFLQSYTLKVPTFAPNSSQFQIFDGIDYRNRPEQFLNGIKAGTLYQLGLEPTSPDQKHIWRARQMA